MRVKDILKKIEDFAPPALAYSWDNVGLLVGDAEREDTNNFRSRCTNYRRSGK